MCLALCDISISNIDSQYIDTFKNIDNDMVIFENSTIDKAILENININKAILKNIDVNIDRKSLISIWGSDEFLENSKGGGHF